MAAIVITEDVLRKIQVQRIRRLAREIRHSRITRFSREGMFAVVPLFIAQAYRSGKHRVKRESIAIFDDRELRVCIMLCCLRARFTMTSHGIIWETAGT